MKVARTLALGTLVVAAAVAGTSHAFTASNSVSSSSVGSDGEAVTAATLQPALCEASGVVPTVKATTGAGTFNGSASSELIVRGANATASVTIDGKGGSNCIVAGSVNNGRTITMRADAAGTTVCIKGPGPGSYVYGPGCDVQG